MKLTIFSLAILALASCAEKKQHTPGVYDPEAVKLNNRGVRLMEQYKNDSALIFFDKAIDTDETYYLPHSNKVNLYMSQRDYKMAMKESELAVEKKPDLAEGWTMAGMLRDKLGDSITANKYYQKSIELFEKRIADSTQREKIVPNRIFYAISLILSGKKEEGKEELLKLKEEKPNSQMIEELQNINRKDFIDKFFF